MRKLHSVFCSYCSTKNHLVPASTCYSAALKICHIYIYIYIVLFLSVVKTYKNGNAN